MWLNFLYRDWEIFIIKSFETQFSYFQVIALNTKFTLYIKIYQGCIAIEPHYRESTDNGIFISILKSTASPFYCIISIFIFALSLPFYLIILILSFYSIYSKITRTCIYGRTN